MSRVLLSGSTGLIGRHVAASRRAQGDVVVALLRNGGSGDGVRWGSDGTLDPDAVTGFNAVIHLAGEPVADGRWTAEKKQRIRQSRAEDTRRLAEALAAVPAPPKVFVCASGINFYGDSGDAVLDETAPLGKGFLADVCKEWEAAPAPLLGISRIVNLRIGVVLTPEGGTLATMLPLFRMCLAGPIAGGRRFVSWITLQDVVRAIDHVIGSPLLQGPVNVVSPEPVRAAEFTKTIAAAVGRPAVIPVPAWAARLMLGELADETVLASVRAVPRRLLESGFAFRSATLAEALAQWKLRG